MARYMYVVLKQTRLQKLRRHCPGEKEEEEEEEKEEEEKKEEEEILSVKTRPVNVPVKETSQSTKNP